jgi:hypothetical protein
MSFATSGQVEVDDATPSAVTYSEVQNTGSMATYADRSREFNVPRKLIISHQQVGSGDSARLRSMIKFTDNVENSALEGDIVEARVHLVLDTPLRVVEKAEVEDMVAQMIDFISAGTFIDQIMNQEV